MRWAGSKRRLLPSLVPFLPPVFGRYFEPFLGSGSLFFLLRPSEATLSDRCTELIETYDALRSNPSAVLRYLAPLYPDRTLYYKVRDSRSSGRFKRAAEFIFINKTCWNGLYRVNQKGKFNVPYGRPRSDFISDPANLRSCAETLATSGIELLSDDFEATVSEAGAGDLVFLDPPYVTGHSNNGFIDYNETLFSWKDQERLASVAERLRQKGAFVLVTNGDHPCLRSLYQTFESHQMWTFSSISGRIDRRRMISEMLFVGRS